jgi:glycosyltransferase involved in cell wall biosynthesis
MNIILINGLNSNVGGGKSILINFLKLLSQKKLSDKYFFLVKNKTDFIEFNNNNIIFISLPKVFNFSIFYPLIYFFLIDMVLKKFKVDVVLNLSDIPIKTNVKQIFLFDWPYAVYPESIVWERLNFYSYYYKKIKLKIFELNIKYIDIFIAQNKVISNRLNYLFGIKNIEIVPNAVSLDNLGDSNLFNFHFPEGVKLLYLTHYYSHKNLEIFIPLAKKIKEQGLNYKIIITIDKSQGYNASKLLKEIRKNSLDDVVINVGPVEMKNVPSLYKQCDGLLMPTLLESFSGTYVEAMFHKIPIFTSNYDFAKIVCKDGAVYFNPLEPLDILEKIKETFNDKFRLQQIINNSQYVLSQLSNWNDSFNLINKIIEKKIPKK